MSEVPLYQEGEGEEEAAEEEVYAIWGKNIQ